MDRAKHKKIILAGFLAGAAMSVMMTLTFRLLGFGWNGGGILLEDPSQSKKLIAVWTEIEPIPLVVHSPLVIFLGISLYGIIHAYLYAQLAPQWPQGVWQRGLRFAALVFGMTFLFWEFLAPFNMFGEPLHLIALELFFWALVALADGLVLALLMPKTR